MNKTFQFFITYEKYSYPQNWDAGPSDSVMRVTDYCSSYAPNKTQLDMLIERIEKDGAKDICIYQGFLVKDKSNQREINKI